jgi:hypothetical protein
MANNISAIVVLATEKPTMAPVIVTNAFGKTLFVYHKEHITYSNEENFAIVSN